MIITRTKLGVDLVWWPTCMHIRYWHFCSKFDILLRYVYLAHMVTNPLTQYPCFSIPFHLYIHDHSNQAGCRLSMVANMYIPPILVFWIKVLYSVTFIWLIWLAIL